jgi:site-specific DNA recombinase
MIAGYYRVSTQRQFDYNHSPERYKELLLQYGIPPEMLFSDVESGGKLDREGLSKVIALMKMRVITKLIVPNFDRLTRNPSDWEELKKIASSNNCEIIFLESGKEDFSSPDGLFMGRIKAAQAAYHLDRVRQHSLDGHALHRKNKKPYCPCFGYKSNGDKLIFNKDIYEPTGDKYCDIARDTILHFLKNTGLNATTRYLKEKYKVESKGMVGHKWLKIPSTASSLKGWLTNPQLAGGLNYFAHDKSKSYIEWGCHEPLISFAEREEVLNILGRNKNHNPGREPSTIINPLAGLCFCFECGAKMSLAKNVTQTNGSFRYRLKCSNAKQSIGRCSQSRTYLSYELVERHLIEALAEKAENVATHYVVDCRESPEVTKLREQISKLEHIADDDLIDVINNKKHLLTEMTNASRNAGLAFDDLLSCFLTPAIFMTEPPYKRNLVYREFVERIVCNQDEFQILFVGWLYFSAN